jgi:alkylation response protein AidB-like acyl-CoA dehydrogenase
MSEAPEEVEPREIAEFRSEVRAWIAANRPPEPDFVMPQNFLFVETDEQFDYLRDWQRKVYEAGYLGLDWPAEYGGGGDTLKRQRIVTQEMARAGAPFFLNTIGLQWAGPVILQYGTEAQKQRFLKPILSAEEIWCQGFSEPGAGSDLASVQTRAEPAPSGEGWIVNGHKVWTTLGTRAEWMILLARTDPDAGKYPGLSFFLMPMKVPGVEVLPLIKMTGEGGFNQVIFTDAPMPGDAMLGNPGQGWEVAMATLTFERGAAEGTGGGQATATADSVRRAAKLAARTLRDGRPASEDPVLRDRLVQLWIQEEGLRLGGLRRRVPGLSPDRPLVLALMNKLVYSEYGQDLAELGCEILGPAGALWMGDPDAPADAEWPRAYMNSFGMTIGGGTSEIQRNILGERILGLPKSK